MVKELFLKKSKIEGAGKGLFTKVKIAKGETIIEYTGRVQTWAEVKEKDADNPYLFYITSKKVLNPAKANKMLAKYANDAMGITRTKGIRNNSEYDIRKGRCFIVAKRTIQPNEEILVGYGKEYWQIMKDEKKKTNK